MSTCPVCGAIQAPIVVTDEMRERLYEEAVKLRQMLGDLKTPPPTVK